MGLNTVEDKTQSPQILRTTQLNGSELPTLERMRKEPI